MLFKSSHEYLHIGAVFCSFGAGARRFEDPSSIRVVYGQGDHTKLRLKLHCLWGPLHKNFEGQMLHCQKAIDGPKHTKGHFNQQHGQPQQQQQGHHQGHHHQGHQGYYHQANKGRYSGGSGGGAGHTSGHLMAPSAGQTVPSVGYNPGVAPAALGQVVAALLATQGAGLGIGNLLGGMGAGVNPQGVPPMMNNAGYGSQSAGGSYGGQQAMQGGYPGQPQISQGGVRPHQGGGPYMGHGH